MKQSSEHSSKKEYLYRSNSDWSRPINVTLLTFSAFHSHEKRELTLHPGRKYSCRWYSASRLSYLDWMEVPNVFTILKPETLSALSEALEMGYSQNSQEKVKTLRNRLEKQ